VAPTTCGARSASWARRRPTRIVKTALDAGINFFDTANVYAAGRSEEILGQSLKQPGVARDEVVIATKVHGQMGEGPNARGASRGHILDQVKASLKRLQLDHIDLYQIHGFDPATPIVETLEALDTLVRQGHVRYLGLSNWAAWQVAKAVGIAEVRRLAPHRVAAGLLHAGRARPGARDRADAALRRDIGLMVWSPLAGGFLSGKFDREGKTAEGRRVAFDFPPLDKDRAYDAIDVMRGMPAPRAAPWRRSRSRGCCTGLS
jgi:aryl-alcohol dehydrogenase-like predicted oxidoreductase